MQQGPIGEKENIPEKQKTTTFFLQKPALST
jgi:hypothetical protein